MFLLNHLPRHHHPVFEYEGFGRSSDDKFMIVIESLDPKFEEGAIRTLLEGIGGYDITPIPFKSQS
jgi:hypothetical protein